LRSPLDPIDIVAIEPYLFKPDFARRDNISRNWRFPGTVRGYVWVCHNKLKGPS
jgi:hypothetical protein